MQKNAFQEDPTQSQSQLHISTVVSVNSDLSSGPKLLGLDILLRRSSTSLEVTRGAGLEARAGTLIRWGAYPEPQKMFKWDDLR